MQRDTGWASQCGGGAAQQQGVRGCHSWRAQRRQGCREEEAEDRGGGQEGRPQKASARNAQQGVRGIAGSCCSWRGLQQGGRAEAGECGGLHNEEAGAGCRGCQRRAICWHNGHAAGASRQGCWQGAGERGCALESSWGKGSGGGAAAAATAAAPKGAPQATPASHPLCCPWRSPIHLLPRASQGHTDAQACESWHRGKGKVQRGVARGLGNGHPQRQHSELHPATGSSCRAGAHCSATGGEGGWGGPCSPKLAGECRGRREQASHQGGREGGDGNGDQCAPCHCPNDRGHCSWGGQLQVGQQGEQQGGGGHSTASQGEGELVGAGGQAGGQGAGKGHWLPARAGDGSCTGGLEEGTG